MGITRILKNHLRLASVGIHPQAKSTHIEAPVKTPLPDAPRIVAVVGARVNFAAIRHRHIRADIAVIDIPLSARTRHHRVERMIMSAAVKSLRDNLFLIHLGIEHIVPVHIGIDVNVGGHRHNDHVVKNADAHRLGTEGRPKNLHRVCFPVGVGILKDLDPRMRSFLARFLQILRDPDPPLRIDIHRNRTMTQVGPGPQAGLQSGCHRKTLEHRLLVGRSPQGQHR